MYVPVGNVELLSKKVFITCFQVPLGAHELQKHQQVEM